MSDLYWIQDTEGVKACVPYDTYGDWTRVRGWTPAAPPTGYERQWIRNANHGGRGVMNHAAVLLHAGLGWYPSDPPPPPGVQDTPPAEPVADDAESPQAPSEPAPPVVFEQPAVGGEETEQVNG